MEEGVKYLYKYLRTGLKSKYDGSSWEVGKWRKVAAPKNECVGLNASEYVQDALGYVQGEILAKVECAGKIIKGSDKWTCKRMRIVAIADWGRRESVSMAVYAARLVLPFWDDKHPKDPRPRKAMEAAEAAIAASDDVRNAVMEAEKAAIEEASSAKEAAERDVWCAAEAVIEAAWSGWFAAREAARDAARSAAVAAMFAEDAAGRKARASVRRTIHRYALSLVKWRKA